MAIHLHFIDTAGGLAAAAREWSGQPWLALDTEFIRVDTYFPRLCLIQVSDGRQHWCIDTLAVPDLEPLLPVLHEPAILKLLHSPSQDLEIFEQLSGRCPAPLFDTQVGATLLGLGDQIGYAPLIEKLLGITLDKSLSRTDWARRPLSPAELAYAAADVAHLAEIYPRMREDLEQRGRLAWLAEDCARMTEPAQYRPDPALAWQRFKGLARLKPAAQQVLAQLAQWRENEARTRNRPRKWILEDDAVYRIAERQPRAEAELEGLQVLPPKTLGRHGGALLQCVGLGLAQPPVALAADDEPTAADKAKLLVLQNALKQIAAEHGLPPSFLAPRAELMALVRAGAAADIVLLKGWRRELAGERLLAQL